MHWSAEAKVKLGIGAGLVCLLLAWMICKIICVPPPPPPPDAVALLEDREQIKAVEAPVVARVALDTSLSMQGYFADVPPALASGPLEKARIQEFWVALENTIRKAGKDQNPAQVVNLEGHEIPNAFSTIWSPSIASTVFSGTQSPFEKAFTDWTSQHESYDQPGTLIVLSDGQISIGAVQSMVGPGSGIAKWLKGPKDQEPSSLPRPRGFAMLMVDLPFHGQYWSEAPVPNHKMPGGPFTGLRPFFIYLLSTSQTTLDSLVRDLRQNLLNQGIREKSLQNAALGPNGWEGDFHVLNLTEDITIETANTAMKLEKDANLTVVAELDGRDAPKGQVQGFPRVFYLGQEAPCQGQLTITLEGFRQSRFWQDRFHQASSKAADRRPEETSMKSIQVGVQESLPPRDLLGEGAPGEGPGKKEGYKWTPTEVLTQPDVQMKGNDMRISFSANFSPMALGTWKIFRVDLALDRNVYRNLPFIKERSILRDDDMTKTLIPPRFQALGLAEFVGNIAEHSPRFLSFYIVLQQTK